MKLAIQYIFISCLILGFYSQPSKAQNIQVEAKLDTTAILLGDQTIFRLRVHLPAKANINFPQLTDSLSSKIQIVRSGKADTTYEKNGADSKIITRDYTITSFDTGYHAIPTFTFKSNSDSVQTNTLFLQVVPVAVDTSKSIYDIKQPLAVSYTWIDWLTDNWAWLCIGIFIILAFLALIYYFKKRPQPKPKPEKAKAIIPAHRIALEKLQQLRQQKPTDDEVKQYYSDLSDIIREYLENRYKINALEQTTAEIFTALKKVQLKGDDKEKLRKILTLADLVKFAKQKPDALSNEISVDSAINFVTQTQERIAQTNVKEGGNLDA